MGFFLAQIDPVTVSRYNDEIEEEYDDVDGRKSFHDGLAYGFM
jgi:hypothetical protein